MMHKLEGFQITEPIDGWEFVSIESDRLQDYLSFFEKLDRNRFGIHVSRVHGFNLSTLDFLASVPDLRALYVQDAVESWRAVESLGELVWLLLTGVNEPLDLACMPNLRILRGEWSKSFRNIDKLRFLEALAWRKFKSKTRDMTELAYLRNLEHLELVQSNLQTLNGLQSLTSLKLLNLYRNRDLASISAVSDISQTLSTFRVENSKKIHDLNVISGLVNLKDLGLSDCGKVDSIQFLESLRHLETLSLVGTEVLDGDLDVLLTLPHLTHAGIDDKRHYSRTYSELKEELHNRHAKY